MTRKTVDLYMNDAINALRKAVEQQRKELLIFYVLIEAGGLWNHFEIKQQERLKKEFKNLKDQGYPGTVEEMKKVYPEMFNA